MRQNSDDALKEAVTARNMTGFSGDAFSGSAMGGGGREEGLMGGGETLESPVLGTATPLNRGR